MYHRLRAFYGLSAPLSGSSGMIDPYNHPETSVGFVSLLVEALVLRHIILGVDQAAVR